MDRLSDLQVFVEAVELGDFSKTAKALGLMPSSVSRSIKRLEGRLGAHLLDRGTRFMRPTAEGIALYGVAKPALGSIRDAEAAIFAKVKVPAGTLRIQAVPTFGAQRLTPLIPAFRARYPDIRLEMIFETEAHDMITNRIDVSLSTGLPQSSSLLSRKVGQTTRIMCASPAYIARKGRPQTLDDLAHHEHLAFMLSTDQRPNNEKSNSLGGYGANIHGADRFGAAIACNNGFALRAMCLAGLGIARLSDYHIEQDLADRLLIDLFPGERHYQNIYALYPKHARNNPRVVAFIDFLQQHLEAVQSKA